MSSILACGDDVGGVDASTDAEVFEDAFVLDAGPKIDAGSEDSGGFGDATIDPDSGPLPDAGNIDGGASDAGEQLVLGFTAGQGVKLAPPSELRVMINAAAGHTFNEVKAILGDPTRKTPGAAARSYEWDLSYGGKAIVWFNNTNLDANPLTAVDGTDTVLWIAVTDGFAGKDGNGIGIGSTKAEVEAAYGAAPREVAVSNPAGSLATYITTGVIFAYEAGTNQVRTITVTRAYTEEPNARIDLGGRRLRWAAGDIDLVDDPLGLPPYGSNFQSVTNTVGAPDAEGDVNLGGNSLRCAAYTFNGFEVFFHPITNTAMFISIHAPFYGTTAGAPNDFSVGSPRAAFESYLTGTLGLGAGAASTSSPDLICYKGGSNAVGATYAATQTATVTSIVLGLPRSICP